MIAAKAPAPRFHASVTAGGYKVLSLLFFIERRGHRGESHRRHRPISFGPGKMEHDLALHIGRRIRARRRILGLTQAQVAAACGLRFQQIQKYECGDCGVSASRLWQLSQCLGLPVSHFFEELSGDDHKVRA